ncbi:MAG TPA: 2-oxoacid:acceptor oxidoreductase family protein [Bacillota bacterium]|nr:2-oxoacid:acceptor oxidoreductase family protein [Bacillota bacterium]
MVKNSEIILSGFGGQGLIMAGQILAEAVVRDGKNTAQTQSYGPEARGGASKAEIIISDAEIDYPKVTSPDILLVMSREALHKYIGKLNDNSTLIVDTTYIDEIPPTPAKVYALPYTNLAKERFGREIVANIVALGVLAALTGVATKESLEAAIISRTPRGTEALNRQAFEFGWQSARQIAA